MLNGCLKEGDFEGAEKYFTEAKAIGIRLDSRVYSTVIQAVCKKPDSDTNAACEFQNEMKEMDWIPSEYTFTSVICACVKQRNLVQALKVKDEMINNGIVMNLVAATSLMKGYCLNGDLVSALYLFDKIVENGLTPNQVTFSVLIEGCCKKGNMKKAGELYERMKLVGIKPSVYNANSLIRGFLNSRSFEEALKCFNEVVEFGIANVFTYNTLISSLCHEGKVNEAIRLFGIRCWKTEFFLLKFRIIS